MPLVVHPPMINSSPARHIAQEGPTASERQVVAVAELKHMRDVESGEAPLQLRLIRILQAGEAAQPGHVVISLGRIINGFRPGVGDQELQAVRVPLLGQQLQPVIDGVGDRAEVRLKPR